ncbi:MAG: hypothetical protein ABR878_13535 [Roseiarcus sp.]|jgi:hypothetical protein
MGFSRNLATANKISWRMEELSTNAERERDDAVLKAANARATVIFLELAEADIAQAASTEPRLDALLSALRNSVVAWEHAQVAYNTAAEASQAVIDSTRYFFTTLDEDTATLACAAAENAHSLSKEAHDRAIAVHNELRLAAKVQRTMELPPMPWLLWL